MKRSTERILTTHTGSLPRPPDLVELLRARFAGQLPDEGGFRARVRQAVADVVRQQVETSLDVISDGEMGKASFVSYVKDRLTGFGGQWDRPAPGDLLAFPEYAQQQRLRDDSSVRMPVPTCIGPVRYANRDALRFDIDTFRAALAGRAFEEAFIPAATPGMISLFFQNRHYPSHDAYLYDLAEAMKEEYRAIYEAGFLLQLDAPDLGMGRHREFLNRTLEEFRAYMERAIEALNHALAGIPPDRVRLHVCWGNYEGPHHLDVPLADIIDILLKARVGALSIEAANPRHAHEWKLFQEVKLPDGMILIPGVIDSTTNFVEHPELVAERIIRFASVIGRENVIAGTDCGFGTFAGRSQVEAKVCWAKLQSLVEGARLASAELWR